MPKRAVILSGSLGLGHDVVSEVVSASLAGLGWESPDAGLHGLLGPRAGRAGDWVFRRLMALPGVFDGLHFAHLRAGSRVATAMDRAATPRLVVRPPAANCADEPADMVISVFAAGVPAAAELGRVPAVAAYRRALPRRPAARHVGPPGHRPVPGDLAGRGGRGAPLPAPGPGRRGPAAGAARLRPSAAARRRPGRRSGYRRTPGASCSWAADGGWARWRGPRGPWPRPGCTCWPWPAVTAGSRPGSSPWRPVRPGSTRTASPRVIAELMSAC